MSVVDTYLVYKIIRALTTPFNETDAFKLELIDDKGKSLKKATTDKEKAAMTYFDRMIFNMKRLLGKVGLTSKLATFAAALFLLKEDRDSYSEEDILATLQENMDYIEANSGEKTFEKLAEEIANSTGGAVVGTGDSAATWGKHPYKVGLPGNRRKIGRYINGVAYLKRMAKEKNNGSSKTS
jgi:hypothetical protein